MDLLSDLESSVLQDEHIIQIERGIFDDPIDMAVCLICPAKANVGSKGDMHSLIGFFILQDHAGQAA